MFPLLDWWVHLRVGDVKRGRVLHSRDSKQLDGRLGISSVGNDRHESTLLIPKGLRHRGKGSCLRFGVYMSS